VPVNQATVRRLCLAVDVESYSRRVRAEQLDLQTRLLWCMAQACRVAGLRPDECARQDSGDGQLLILPAGVNEAQVIPGLVTGLLTALRRVNHPVGSGGRMRLRIALGQGAVQDGPTGFIGPAVVEVCRILDSDELRAALAAEPELDATVIVTADLYRDIFAQGIGGLPAGSFRPVDISKEAKGFAAQAWISVPGRFRPCDDIPSYTESPDLAHWKRPRSSALLDLGAAAGLAWLVFTSATKGGPDPGHLVTPGQAGHGPAGHQAPDHLALGHPPSGHEESRHPLPADTVFPHDLAAHAGHQDLTGHFASPDVAGAADVSAYQTVADSPGYEQTDDLSGYDTPYEPQYDETTGAFGHESGNPSGFGGFDDLPPDTHHHGTDLLS
jgi:hypothetical protein